MCHPLSSCNRRLAIHGKSFLRLLLGIEVVEVADELMETMVGGQVLIPVSRVVFAEPAAHVAFLFASIRAV